MPICGEQQEIKVHLVKQIEVENTQAEAQYRRYPFIVCGNVPIARVDEPQIEYANHCTCDTDNIASVSEEKLFHNW